VEVKATAIRKEIMINMYKDKQNFSSNKQSFSSNKFFFFVLFLTSTIIIFLPLLFKAQFAQVRSLGLLGIFLINAFSSATIFFPVPGILSVGIGGSLYHPLLVATVASLGSSIGEITTFIFGLSSKEILHLPQRKFLSFLNAKSIQKSGPWLVFLFSFVPNPFFDGIGMLVGMTSYSLVRFLLIVFTGRLARNLIIAYIGSYV